MANAKAPLTFLPEPYGEERPVTNVETEEALQKLLEALEARQTRRFDPRMLALAEGFLAPTRTGSGFEAIGRAVGKYREAEEAERLRDVELAQQRLGIISQMGEIERRKQRDKLFGRSLGLEPDVEGTTRDIEPETGKTVDGTHVYTPPGLKSMPGIQIMPPNKNIPTGRQYLQSAYIEGKEDYSTALAKAAEIERKRYEVRENSIVDLALGLRFDFPQGPPVERQIIGVPGHEGTYKIPSNIASQMDFYQQMGDWENYNRAARRALGLDRGAAQPPKAGAAETPVSSTKEPSTAAAPEVGIKSEAQKSVEKIAREKTAEKEAEINVEAEAALGSNSKSAREMFNASQRLQKATAESPLVFGVLQTPGIGSAILSLIDEGIQAGNTSIRLGGLQGAIIRSVPGVTKKDIVNLERALSALAEIELKYTQLYLKGQGQVTEGERKIVGKLSGTERSSPEFLNTQAKLIQMRSQFDIDVIDTFRRIKEKNPNITWINFQRSSAYREMENEYDKRIAKEFNLEPAVPSGERGGSSTFSVDAFEKALKERAKQ